GLVFNAPPRAQVEMLLVHRRRDHELPAQVADQPARNHIGAAEGITILEREDFLPDPQQRHLFAVHQRTDAGTVQDVVQTADEMPLATAHALTFRLARSCCVAGRRWPRSSTSTMFASTRSLLTKWRKR